MRVDRVRRLPQYIYRAEVRPPKIIKGRSDRAVFGFDTEFDSVTRELISVQLYRPGFELFYPVPRGFKLTYRYLRELIAQFKAPFLVAFFSLAEISQITDYWRASLTETGVGMLMANWRDMTIFDISTFWSSDRTFSLRKLGELIDLPKLEYDRANISRDCLGDPEFERYAMRDAEITYRAYDEFLRSFIWDKFDLDILHFRSAPTISSNIFRSRLRSPIVPPPRVVRQLALACYWGGRSEVFRVGQIKASSIVEIDANSQYPRSAIALGNLPDGCDWQVATYRDRLDDFRDGFVEVLFQYPPAWPGFYALPVLYGERLYWPPRGVSYCTIAELKAAVEACPGLVYIIRAMVGYKEGSRHELGSYLARLLLQKDRAIGKTEKFVFKLLANSLIGKLAQNRKTGFDALHLSLAHACGLPAQYLPRFWTYRRTNVGNCFWPEAAALILGRARAGLFKIMEQIGRDRLILCSTDSVIYVGDARDRRSLGVPYEVERVGDACQVWREKVYSLHKGPQLLKAAHHALPRHAVVDGNRVILDRDATEVVVDYREFAKIARASRGAVLGEVIPRHKTVSLLPSKFNNF